MQSRELEPNLKRTSWAERTLLHVPEALSALLLALLIIFLVVSVFSRYVMNLGLAWSDELSRLLFVWITLMGFALAVSRRENVGVDWLVSKVNPEMKKWIFIAQDTTILAFSVFFTWASWVTVKFAMMQRMPALDIATAWLYGSCLVAGGLMILYAFFNLILSINGKTVELSYEKL